MRRSSLHDNGLLDVLRHEVWPLSSDRGVVTTAERARILGYDPDTGACGLDGV